MVPEVHLATVPARDSLDLELQQSRDVEDDAHGRDESDRRLHTYHADDVARLERVTDCQIASHRHDDRQPRAHLDERVDKGATVRTVDQLEANAPIGESVNRESYQSNKKVFNTLPSPIQQCSTIIIVGKGIVEV